MENQSTTTTKSMTLFMHHKAIRVKEDKLAMKKSLTTKTITNLDMKARTKNRVNQKKKVKMNTLKKNISPIKTTMIKALMISPRTPITTMSTPKLQREETKPERRTPTSRTQSTNKMNTRVRFSWIEDICVI